MNWFDSLMMLFMLLSLSVGFVQGLHRAALSFVSWLSAALVSVLFMHAMASLLSLMNESVRLLSAFILLTTSTLLLSGLLGYLLLQTRSAHHNSNHERILASIFGLGRGAIMMFLLLVTASLLHLSNYAWWQDSFLIQAINPSLQRLNQVIN